MGRLFLIPLLPTQLWVRHVKKIAVGLLLVVVLPALLPARDAREQADWAYRPLISVITPVYATDPTWLHAAVESVRRQAYPLWFRTQR